MVYENSHWGVYHYKRAKKSKRTIATLVAKFDTAAGARQLVQNWRGIGQVYAGPCAADAKIAAAGKRKMTEHRNNEGAIKVRPDPAWQYISPNWNHQTVQNNAD